MSAISEMLHSAGAALGSIALTVAAGNGVRRAVGLLRTPAEKREFEKLARDGGFDENETETLWSLGSYAPKKRRFEVLRSWTILDNCIRVAGESGNGKKSKNLSPEITGALLRKCAKASGLRQIYTTREIEPHQPVSLQIGNSSPVRSFVMDVTDQKLMVAIPQEGVTGAVPPGKRVCLSFWRPHDARYECHSHAMNRAPAKADSSESYSHRAKRFGIAHAPLNRIQERKHSRIRCFRDLRFGIVAQGNMNDPADDNLPYPAMLRDISEGGACFISDKPVSVGAALMVRVEGKGRTTALQLPARVLRRKRLEETSNPMWANSVCFERKSERALKQLSRFLTDQRRQLAMGLRSRAGVGHNQLLGQDLLAAS